MTIEVVEELGTCVAALGPPPPLLFATWRLLASEFVAAVLPLANSSSKDVEVCSSVGTNM
jgi:hypothetical protein